MLSISKLFSNNLVKSAVICGLMLSPLAQSNANLGRNIMKFKNTALTLAGVSGAMLTNKDKIKNKVDNIHNSINRTIDTVNVARLAPKLASRELEAGMNNLRIALQNGEITKREAYNKGRALADSGVEFLYEALTSINDLNKTAVPLQMLNFYKEKKQIYQKWNEISKELGLTIDSLESNK